MLKAGVFAAASTILMSAAPVFAADMASSVPSFAMTAVDGVNGKLEAFFGPSDYRIVAGRGDSANTFGIAGSVSAPLGQSFGMQIDVAGASRDGAFSGAGAGHFFWRDPSKALFGVYGSYANRGGLDERSVRLALEGEAYFGRFTIGGIAGFERTIASSQIIFIPFGPALITQGSENRFFNAIDLSFYATDNFKLSVGHRYSSGIHMGAVGAEYMVQTGSGAAYSFFAEGRMGEQRFAAAMAGVRVYFGQKDKTLIRRHREDDPPNYLGSDILSPSGTTAQGCNRKLGFQVNPGVVMQPVFLNNIGPEPAFPVMQPAFPKGSGCRADTGNDPT
ncbi:MAG: hypothetical protein K2Y29_13920 [Beijerinckiaceae bacterium]|nr:hypothetical protein [Beijerinckiaceae bacterium]